MRYFLLLVFCLLLFISRFESYAQAQVYSSRQFTISNGLSGNSVIVVFQDSKGFIWIGTENGLNRYDGEKFDVFKHQQTDTNAVSGNYIISLAEDLEGNIWIGTRNRGISVYNRNSGRFKSFMHQQGNVRSLPENDVLGFFVSKEGEIWVKTESYLCRFESETNDFTNFGHYSNLFKRAMSFGYPIVYESDSTFLVGTKDGINRFNSKMGSFERLFVNANSNSCNDLISEIVKVRYNLYLAATHSGLQLFEPSVSITSIPPKSYPGTELAVNTVFSDKKGIIWVGTKKGLEMFNPELMVHETIYKKRSDKQPVVPYEVTSIIEDASGLIWVGTRFNGLFKLSTNPPKFTAIGEEDVKDWPLRSFNIQSVYYGDDENIWIGTLSSGVYSLNRKSKKLQNYRMSSDRFQNEDDAVFSIFRNDDGVFWFGTNSGIYLLNPESGQIKEFNYGWDTKYSTLLRNNHVVSITKDSVGAIWFGTKFGLYRYYNGRIIPFFKGSEDNLPSDMVNVLLPDGSGKLWIGTEEGLCYYDLVKGLLQSVKVKKQQSDLQQQISSLALANDGKLWIGTHSGLLILKKDSVGEYEVSAIDGLKDKMINGILIDKTHKVWISSEKGISFLAPDESIQSFDVIDGIPGHVFNMGSVYQASSGELFFGSVSGLCWLHPDSISYNLHRPRITIAGISVCYRGDCKEVYNEGLNELEIKYRPGMMIEISFAALEYTHPLKNRFRVILEGYDKGWRQVTQNNTITFSNLMPGEYNLKVIASNNDLIWNNKPLEFPLVIHPPLWMTVYAYAFYILVVVFSVQLIVNYRIRHYRKANRSLTEKAQDKKRIEVQSKALSYINQSLTDSITYATRIQSAMIPTEKRLRELVPESFVYFRPRDMVSGDFYYVYDNGQKTFISVVDCTGHGVPGAFMSIIGMDLLKRIIEGNKEEDPSRILEIMSHELGATLRNDEASHEEGALVLRDGMDIGLCVIDRENESVDFAGAVNVLYLVRNNEIIPYKGNRYPIGQYADNSAHGFETIHLTIEKDDMFYLFTDGYADQFGGSEKKKLKYRRFRHILLNIHQLSSDDQKAILHQKLEEWKGDLEQVDDILILGFKPFGIN